MLRFAVIAGLAASLCGCINSGEKPVAASSLEALALASAPRNASSRADDRAMVSLPTQGGRVERFRTETFTDGVRQTIIYAQPLPGLGANAIDLRLRTSREPALEGVSIEKPTEAAIRAELASQFPRMQMRIVDPPRRNVYGVYGLAVGRWVNGARCLYAWQWIETLPIEGSSNAGSASVRLRICRASGTLDDLAAVVDGLRIDAVQPTSAPQPVIAARIEPPASARAAVTPAPTHFAVARQDAPRRPHSQPSQPVATEKPADNNTASSLDPSLPAAAFRGPIVAAARSTGR